MKKVFPILDWLPKYNKEFLRDDIVGGLTVGIVLIPQGIAYALIAGLPPIYGLYSALLPQVMYLLFGTSQRVAVGPVAMDSLIVAAGVSTLAQSGTDAYISLTIVLAFVTGVIQLLLGVFRLGFIVNFLSKPVISGFSSAAAIIIGVNQFKNFFGIPIPRSNQLQEIGYHFYLNISQIHWSTFFIGGSAFVILYTIKLTKSKLPGPLLVVVLGTVALAIYHDSLTGVQILQDIPSGLPSFQMPVITIENLIKVFPIAATLAIIGFLETISIGKALEKSSDTVMIAPNKELIALGMMNSLGSFFKSYPSTASFSRSAVNEDAGSRTGLAALFSVFVIVMVLLFLTPYFYYLPKAVLAAIIIVSVIKLVNYKEAIRLWKLNKTDFWMLIVTFIVTVSWGIKEGITIGVVLSLIMLIYRTSKPHIAVLGRIPETNIFRNVNRFEEVEVDKDVLIIRFDARLYFANANYFVEQLQEKSLEKGSALRLIVLDCECINGLDTTAVQMLETAISYYNDKQIEIVFTNIKGPVRDMLSKSGLVDKIGVEKFFINNHGAMEYYKTGSREHQQKLADYIQQVNVKK